MVRGNQNCLDVKREPLEFQLQSYTTQQGESGMRQPRKILDEEQFGQQ